MSADISDYIEIYKNNIKVFKSITSNQSDQIIENNSSEQLANQQLIQMPIWITHLTTKCNLYKDHRLQLMCYNTLINEFEAVFKSVIEIDSVTGLYNSSKNSNKILKSSQ